MTGESSSTGAANGVPRRAALPRSALVAGVIALWVLGVGAIAWVAYWAYVIGGLQGWDCFGKRGAEYRRCESDVHSGQVGVAVLVVIVGLAILWLLTWLILRAHQRSLEADAARARDDEWRATRHTS